MKIICCLVCAFLLSSCVYYGVEYEFDSANKSTTPACDTGSKKQKQKCRADLKKLNEAIQIQKSLL
ncbi:hypothetical protein [Thalassotalea sp. ND16A]|uniref:hypothetical protein n=1 Tax=Thalassotalea sp. ND16A TaxID=1535422 RepID=UPI00051D6DAD|nr:hypothetical protein [Thalassotalea sp. ND16A]KGJ92432.1 lipoprotein [Thalassotalea sp. ND16A]